MFLLVFLAVSRFTKNGETRHRRLFFSFLGAFKSGAFRIRPFRLRLIRRAWNSPFFPCFCMFFRRCHVSSKMKKRDTPAFFLVFWAHSKAVPLNFKNEETWHPRLFSRFLGAFKSGVTKRQKWRSVTPGLSQAQRRPCRRASPAGRPPNE